MNGLIMTDAGKFPDFSDGQHLAAIGELQDLFQVVTIGRVFHFVFSFSFRFVVVALLHLHMVCYGLALVAVHGFDVAGFRPAFPLRGSCGCPAYGTRKVADVRALSPALTGSMAHVVHSTAQLTLAK